MVRATFAGFSTAFSALQANQKRLDLVGQNLSNMNTPGYTRQQLKTTSMNYTNPISYYLSPNETPIGFGVLMEDVVQVRDPYLDIQYRNQMTKSGYNGTMETSLKELSRFFDESSLTGIRNAFDDIKSTLTTLQDGSKVHDAIFQNELRTRMQALTNLINDGADRIDAAKRNEYLQLDGSSTTQQGAVDKINDILQRIGNLNRQIKDNQIFNQPALELLDERNQLLDELSSYVPIEVSYYKDAEHDGLDASGNYDPDKAQSLKAEQYYLNSAKNIVMKKEWPDDLRVTMTYLDGNTTKQLVLVEGTVGKRDENYAQLKIANSTGILNGTTDPSQLELTFTNGFSTPAVGTAPYYGVKAGDITFKKGADPTQTIQFPEKSGSVQASLDMLWQDGTTEGYNKVNGYDYYMNELDRLAYTFGSVMNEINAKYKEAGNTGELIDLSNLPTTPTATSTKPYANAARNIRIHDKWLSGTSHVGTSGDNSTDAVMDMLEAMSTVYYTDSKKNANNFLGDDKTSKYNGNNVIMNANLDNNTFIGFINHVSTVLANDSYTNQYTLKNNVTVLNGIQDSRDDYSGVSLDEEASNMMMYMSAYNAASRLMTTLDEALNTLINNTGLVGR